MKPSRRLLGRARLLALIFGLVLLGCGGGNTTRVPIPPEPQWSYSGVNGPDAWGELWSPWATCDTSMRQSPIDIVGAENDPALSAISLAGYHANTVDLVNTGYAIEQEWYAGSSLDWNGATYELERIRFHTASEHTVAGVGTAMEVQFIHRNTVGYDLLVIAVLIDDQGAAPNPFLALIEDTLPAAQGDVVVTGNYIDPPASLLADPVRSYYVYEGSLTTPPCSPIVTWIVPKTPSQATPAQIAKFSGILNSNSRPVQPLKDRVIKQTP